MSKPLNLSQSRTLL